MHTTINNFLKELGRQPVLFLSVWTILFSLLVLGLVFVGFAPAMLLVEAEEEKGEESNVRLTIVSQANASEPVIVEESHINEIVDESVSVSSAPVRVIIDKIGVDTKILNPKNTDIASLDNALLSGAVHYPGSGNLEDTSNMFVFGHSSHLPVVYNQAFRSFNNLENLNKGDLIRVQSGTHEYHYRVEVVDLVKAEDAWVVFDSEERRLTLSTCNNFGSKQDRFVVESSFIGSFAL